MNVIKSILGIFKPLLDPIRIAVFALLGAGLAALWVGGKGLIAIAIVLVLIVVTIGAELIGRKLLPRRPVGALAWFELRVLGVGATAAAATAATVLFGLSFTAADEPLKSLLSSIAATLGALVAAITTKPEDADAAIGNAIRDIFYSEYGLSPNLPDDPDGTRPAKTRSAGKILFPKKSSGLHAIFDNEGIPDWTRPNRWKRARFVRDYLKMTENGLGSHRYPASPDGSSRKQHRSGTRNDATALSRNVVLRRIEAFEHLLNRSPDRAERQQMRLAERTVRR